MGFSLRPSFLYAVSSLGFLSQTVSAAPLSACEIGFTAANTITKDVAIIGGGATGTYSAVRLREDMGKSVVVVEMQNRLGGHTQTYIDPATGVPIDYGVQTWNNLTVVTNFFARFDVPLTVATSPFSTQYIDLKTGKPLAGYPSADPTAALTAYSAQLQKYPYLVGGYQLPSPVPADLLLPFGTFVTKYQLQAALPIFYLFISALGDILNEPTIYIMQNFGLVQLQGILENSYLTTAQHDNSIIYQKAQALLGTDALLSTTVVQTCRGVNGYNEVVVKTPAGKKLIKAKKLLVTIPPVLDNLLPSFDLDIVETAIFSRFHASSYWTGLVSNTGLPDGFGINNVDTNSTLHYPSSPFVGSIDFTGLPGVHRVDYISQSTGITQAQAKTAINNAILSMNNAGTYATTTPTYLVLSSHAPLQIRVSALDIQLGFYNQLYGLQGRHATYYTGAAWAADYSTLLWQFTEGVLPLVAA